MQNKNRFLQRYQRQQEHLMYNLKNFLNKNWQKLTLLLIIILVFTHKDLTIHFDLSSPFRSQSNTPAIEEQFPSNSGNIKQGFTEQLKKDSRSETFSLFPFFFGTKEKDENQVLPTLEGNFTEVKKSKKEAYIKRYSHIAVAEMQQFGVPASITLGQGLLHGQAGTGALVDKANNHFSITCGSSWKEPTTEIQGVCYRKYPSAWKSFRDHSELITRGRFTDLKQYSSTDYKKWAIGLAEKGYSTDEKYADLLIQIIKDYNLDKFDE